MKVTSLTLFCISLIIISSEAISSSITEATQADTLTTLISTQQVETQQRVKALWQTYPVDKKLCMAIRYNHIDKVKQVVEAEQADVNSNTVNCRFPLGIAAQRNLVDIADYLISRGAKMEIEAAFGLKISALEMAAKSRKNRTEMIELLLSRGTTMIRKKLVNGGVLNRVIAKGHLSNIETLLKHGADPNGFYKSSSVLMDAVNQLSLERVKLLIDHGADVNLKDSASQTVLKRLRKKKTSKNQKKEALIAYLVSVGAK